jgi:hypothetical protein
MKSPLVTALLTCAALGAVASPSAAAFPSSASSATPRFAPRINVVDHARWIDINRINMVVANDGSFGFNTSGFTAGLLYPKGQTTSALFAGGLWIGADFLGTPRVTVAEYGQEYRPGRILSTGVWEDPDNPSLIVYKVKRWTGNPEDSAHVEIVPSDPTQDPLVHHGWGEYMAGAASHGAPVRVYHLPITDTPDPSDSVAVLGPDVSGDQMLWCVFNDADPTSHHVDSGRTAPIGVEVQQTVFGFDRPGPLGDVVFIRYRIINRTLSEILDLHPAVWADPDIGDYKDDLGGADIARHMGYTFNGDGQDDQYGPNPPALGIRLLAGQPMWASSSYRNGEEPANATESRNYLQGLNRDGTPVYDFVANGPTRYQYSGNPVNGVGYIDSPRADKRMLVTASDVLALAPDDTAEVVAAVVLGRGDDHIKSINIMRCNADFAAESFASGFSDLDPEPGPAPCDSASDCPRPLSFWQAQCTSGGIPAADLQKIAVYADAQSAYFTWGSLAPYMCATLNSTGTDARSEAERQFATLLANVMAARYAIPDDQSQPIILSPLTTVACPGIDGSTIQDLLIPGRWPPSPDLMYVAYLDGPGGNFQALEGTGMSNLTFFGGGADFAFKQFGSSLHPTSSPDSFSSVEIRFSTVPQKAYRYLRRERLDGQPPSNAPVYTYAGFFDVPFQVWDTDRNVQLDAGFVERVITDDDGTILPPAFQPSTFDSTWGPTDAPDGGHEYVLVYRNAYAGTPDPMLSDEFDNVGFPSLPGLYVLAPRLSQPMAIIDPGDRVVFAWGVPPSPPGIDQLMIDLSLRPQDDPDVLAAYANIASCLSAVNSTCDIPTPALVSLVSATATPEAVELAWYAPALQHARIERRSEGAWSLLAEVVGDGRDMITWTDRTVDPGTRYGYRLVDARGVAQGETWVEVPSTYRVSLAGIRPNPYSAGALVTLTLRGRAPARLDVIDVAGRRVASRDVGGLGSGTHVLRIEELDRLPVGVYLLRVTQGSESAMSRVVHIK